jgi:hypothetical protein
MNELVKKEKPGMSIIVPFLNEEAGIELFCCTIDKFTESLAIPFVMVFVYE